MLNLWISIGSADVSLHKKNLYLTFGKSRMIVQHMVAAIVVMVVSSVACAVAVVPDVRKL